ncbi:MAG: type IV pilus biogenesis protein PilM [Patescibacteria group bacterium]
MRSRFLRSFPVPSFLMMPAACIAVSDECLRYVELKKGERSMELSGHMEKRLSESTIVSGEIQDHAKLLASLKEMKEELGLKHVSMSLPEEKGYVYTTYVPAENEGVTEEQVAFTLEKNVPFAVDEVVFDYVETGEKNKQGKEVVVMVLPNNIMEGYMELLEEAGLTPVFFEIESYSLSRATVNAEDPRTHILVHIQKGSTNISIISRNISRFTSTVHNGVDPLLEDDPHRSALWLKEEIERVRHYWHSHGSEKTGDPQTVILCGEMVGQRGEKEVIASGLDMEVNIANVWENVISFDEHIPDLPHAQSLKFGVAIGLAVKEIKRRY